MRGHFIRTILLLIFCFPALAAELPALTGRVVDNANLIDRAAEAELTEKLAAFEQRTSDQIVVATLETLDGEAIEPFANRLFRAWELGQAGEDNGVLLLVAAADRRMRIEVGYGLEGALTDLHSKLIIENTMVPAFRAGNFSAGIAAAVDDIIMVLEGDAAELEARAERNRQSEPFWTFGTIFVLLWIALFVGGFAMALLPPIFGHKTGPRRYRWLGMDFHYADAGGRSGYGGMSSGGWSSGGGEFSGGGGSSGGGGASGGW